MTQKIPIIEQTPPKSDPTNVGRSPKGDDAQPFDDLLLKPGVGEEQMANAPDRVKSLNEMQARQAAGKGKKVVLKSKPILDTSKIVRSPEEQKLAEVSKMLKEREAIAAQDQRSLKPTKLNEVDLADKIKVLTKSVRKDQPLEVEENLEKAETLPVDHVSKLAELISGVAIKQDVNTENTVNPVKILKNNADVFIDNVEKTPVISTRTGNDNSPGPKATPAETKLESSVKMQGASVPVSEPSINQVYKADGNPTSLESNSQNEPAEHDLKFHAQKVKGETVVPASKATPAVPIPEIKLPEGKESSGENIRLRPSDTPVLKNRPLQKVDMKTQNLEALVKVSTEDDVAKPTNAKLQQEKLPLVEHQTKTEAIIDSDPKPLNKARIIASEQPQASKPEKTPQQNVFEQVKVNPQLNNETAVENVRDFEAKIEVEATTPDKNQTPRIINKHTAQSINEVAKNVKYQSNTPIDVNNNQAGPVPPKLVSRVNEQISKVEIIENQKNVERLAPPSKPEDSSLKSVEATISSQNPQVNEQKSKARAKPTRSAKVAQPGSKQAKNQSRRSQILRDNYGVDSTPKPAAEKVEENPADTLKEQLRERIEVLKKAQDSMNLSPEQTGNQNLHRNMSMRVNPAANIVMDQTHSMAHVRTKATLFARSFASEMVDKIREVASKHVGGPRSLQAKFVVNGGNLGQLDIEFQQETNRDTIIIHVENETARNELMRILPQIDDNLQQRGFNINQVDVEVREDQQESASANDRKTGDSDSEKNETFSSEQGIDNDTEVTNKRSYGYNTMEVLA